MEAQPSNLDIPDPIITRIENEENLTLENVDQYLIQCEHKQKFKTVADIIRRVPSKVFIIFCNKNSCIHRLQQYLQKQGLRNVIIDPKNRDKPVWDNAIGDHGNGGINILLPACTFYNWPADFRLESLVINVEQPTYKEGGNILPDPITYLRRVGYPGRDQRRAVAVNILVNTESQDIFRAIQNYFHNSTLDITIDALVQRMQEV